MAMQPRLCSHQIERFLNPLDSFQVSIWERTHRECLGLEHRRRLDKTSITFKRTEKSDFLPPVEQVGYSLKFPFHVCGNT